MNVSLDINIGRVIHIGMGYEWREDL